MGEFKLLVELFEKIEQLGCIEEFRKGGEKIVNKPDYYSN